LRPLNLDHPSSLTSFYSTKHDDPWFLELQVLLRIFEVDANNMLELAI
jgi:hypothetical protein